MITGDIHTLEDGMRVVAGMMRTHHDCARRGRTGNAAGVRRARGLLSESRCGAQPETCP